MRPLLYLVGAAVTYGNVALIDWTLHENRWWGYAYITACVLTILVIYDSPGTEE